MNFTLVSADRVPELFVDRIKNRARHEAAFVTSMSADFHNNPITESLVKYGSPHDIFMLDYFGHWHDVRPAILMRQNHRAARRQFQESFRGSYMVVGPPPKINFTNSTIINRSHLKAYIVGDRIISLGGVNCVPYSYYNFVDVMLDFESPEFADFLIKYSKNKANLRPHGPGESLQLNRHNRILVDYGHRNNFYGGGNRSIIMNNLLHDLKDNSVRKVIMSSTSIPSGGLDSRLAGHAQRGIPITFYTNRPSKFAVPYSGKVEAFLQKFYAMKAKTPWTDNLKTRFNHLKAAIIFYSSGQQVAYIGSHNFNQLHVWAGNAEVSLRTTDGKLIAELNSFITQNLASPLL